MAVEGEELRELLAGAGLEPARLRARPPLPDGTVAWLLDSGSPGWFTDWKVLRDLVEVSGRWPLAVAGWPGGDGLNRLSTDPRDGSDLSPAGVVGWAAGLDLDAWLDREAAAAEPVDLEEWYDLDLEPTLARCGRAPSLSQLREAVGDEPRELDLERWVLDREQRHGATGRARDGEPGYLRWFEPGDGVEIVLLPTGEPWAVPAYVGTYSAAFTGPAVQVALLRRWYEWYGAEPVASWDTTLLPGVTVREHARDLVGLDRWFLHLRP